MSKIELSTYDAPLHCPFCGKKVLHEDGYNVCEHTLYIGTDEGEEYVSDRLDEAAFLERVGEDGFEAAGDALEYSNIAKFSVFVPAPSGLSSYVAFAPLVD